MSLKSKIEAVIYASEEPVTLQQLVGVLAGEAGAEIDQITSAQASLALNGVEQKDASTDGLAEVGTEARQPATVFDQREEVGSDARPGSAAAARSTEAEASAPGLSWHDTDTSEAAAPPAIATESILDGQLTSEPSTSLETTEYDKQRARNRERAVREHIRRTVDRLIRDYAESERGIEIREVASGFRMGTKPEYHDAVRGFVKSLKPALKLTLPALETLAVVAYKQPVTAAEISEIRGVDSAGVLGGLMARKLIATAGRKQVIGRPMLYKTTRDFLLRFGLKDVQELPSMEEFERMAGELVEQEDFPMEHAETLVEQANARGDAEHILRDEQTHEVNVLADDAPTVSEAASNEPENQKATAESAAGGGDDYHTQNIQHGPAQAETLKPTQDGDHGPADHTGRESSTSEHGYREEIQ